MGLYDSILGSTPKDLDNILLEFDKSPLHRGDYVDGKEIENRRQTVRDYVIFNFLVRHYIKTKYGLRNYKDLVRSCVVDETFKCDPRILLARTANELKEAKEGKGITTGPIDVFISNDEELVVYDGHHRLFNALINKDKFIKIHIVSPYSFRFMNSEEKY